MRTTAFPSLFFTSNRDLFTHFWNSVAFIKLNSIQAPSAKRAALNEIQFSPFLQGQSQRGLLTIFPAKESRARRSHTAPTTPLLLGTTFQQQKATNKPDYHVRDNLQQGMQKSYLLLQHLKISKQRQVSSMLPVQRGPSALSPFLRVKELGMGHQPEADGCPHLCRTHRVPQTTVIPWVSPSSFIWDTARSEPLPITSV